MTVLATKPIADISAGLGNLLEGITVFVGHMHCAHVAAIQADKGHVYAQ